MLDVYPFVRLVTMRIDFRYRMGSSTRILVGSISRKETENRGIIDCVGKISECFQVPQTLITYLIQTPVIYQVKHVAENIFIFNYTI